MKFPAILVFLSCATWMPTPCIAAGTHQYLFLGHPRSDGAGEVVQREVERIDYAAFDLVLLGGDYTLNGTGTIQTVDYLDSFFNFSAPTTLAALGNHDTGHTSYFTAATARPRYYAQVANGITFVVLDTNENGRNIQGAQLQMLADAVHAMPANSHLVVVHHHFIWLTDNAINCPHYADNDFIASSSSTLAGLNFYTAVYPLLLEAHAKGGEVICLGGDRTGTTTQEYYIDHTTTDGVRFIGAGLKDILSPALRTVVVLEQDEEAGTLTCQFKHLTDLPKIPDETLVINEMHYDPAAAQGDDTAFVELFNRGNVPYDLSGASFWSGVVFTFPAGTIVAPGEYILVAANPIRHVGLGVRVFDYSGSAKPNSNDAMWLRGSDRREIDHVKYGVTTPWPSLPDDQGPSLMLIDSGAENNLAFSWAASDQLGGTPGRINIAVPRLGQITLAGGVASVQYHDVVPNGWYRLDFTPTLNPPDWQAAGAATVATTTSIQLSDPGAQDAPRRFFRLARIFP